MSTPARHCSSNGRRGGQDRYARAHDRSAQHRAVGPGARRPPRRRLACEAFAPELPSGLLPYRPACPSNGSSGPTMTRAVRFISSTVSDAQMPGRVKLVAQAVLLRGFPAPDDALHRAPVAVIQQHDLLPIREDGLVGEARRTHDGSRSLGCRVAWIATAATSDRACHREGAVRHCVHCARGSSLHSPRDR
jgi:hypothetical protein